MEQFNLGWGESVAVRKAFLKQRKNPIVFDTQTLESLGYPDYAGNPALIELTRKIIKRNIGKDYKHILITNGATGGATIAIRSFRMYREIQWCVTDKPPYFRFYPNMIRAAGMNHLHRDKISPDFTNNAPAVFLIDSLSNPLGKFSQHDRYQYPHSPVIWDAVYYGRVYTPGVHPQPDHDVLVGSYSKLTGLNGLRVGWIACNDDNGYKYMKTLVTAEYCGISVASTKIIMDTAGQFTDRQWDAFEITAAHNLDCNREEFSKLEKFFGGTPVGPYGMFYYAPVDAACKNLLEKSGIIWSSGSQLHHTDDFGRFNIGQDVKLVKQAVTTILKNDKKL